MQRRTGFMHSFFMTAGLCAILILHTVCAGFSAGSRTGQDRRTVSADGVYEGSARGYRGPIRVRVRMEAGSIAEISVIDSGEDPFVGGAAIDELLETVLTHNTTDLDAVSGATESSEGFLAAVENAIMTHE